MIGRLRSGLKSDLVRGATKLASGTGLAQLITVAAAPILTRLYTPTDFGIFAAYFGISVIIIGVSAARYELAIMLPDDEDEAVRVSALALAIVGATSLVTLLLAVPSYVLLEGFAPELSPWVLLIPATVLFGGWSSVFVSYANRHGRFGAVGTTAVLRQSLAVAVQVTLGVLGVTPGGLLLGGFAGFAAANLRLARPLVAELRRRRPSRSELRASATRYSRFPKFTLPASTLGLAGLQGTPLVVGALFGAATLGIWTLTRRVVLAPSSLVGTAVAESYYRRAVQLRGSAAAGRRLYDKTLLSLAALSVLPFLAIILFAPSVFSLVFGEEWSSAGTYAQVMAPWVWLQFIASPVSRTTLVYGRNDVGLFVQSWLLMMVLIATGSSLLFDLAFVSWLTVLSTLNALSYLGLMILWRGLISEASDRDEPEQAMESPAVDAPFKRSRHG